MKKNAYYRTVISRPDKWKYFTSNLFLELCSWPRFLLEVFTRRNFGRRYFNLGTSIFIAIVLWCLPLVSIKRHFSFNSYAYSYALPTDFYLHYTTWYLYLVIFIIVCFKHYDEMRDKNSVFDFSHYSKSAGIIHPVIRNIKWNGKFIDLRTFETIVEPGIFFLIGVTLMMLQQYIGILIIVCSFFYSVSYFAAYHLGDEYILDKIDETICKQDLAETMLDGREPSEARGFRFYGSLPNDPEDRKILASTFWEEEAVEVR